MPRNYIKKKDGPSYTLQDIKNAVTDVQNKNMTYRQAEDNYGVPKAVIFHRINGRKISLNVSGSGRSQALTPALEEEIVKCLVMRSNMGLPCDKKELLKLVGKYVEDKKLKTPFRNGVPGQDWYYAFMKRHPRLSLKKPEHLQKLRKDARKPEIIYNFYEKLKNVVSESNLDSDEKSCFIFNADESGFNSDPSRVRGIGMKGKALCRISGGSGRESTTVLACVAADGKVMPPLIIFKGAAIQARWTSNAAYPGTMYATSKNGWMEEPQFFQWFTAGFIPYVKKLREKKNLPEQTAVLLYDGHCSHISVRLIEEAIKNNIVLVKFPSHLTDKLQPLDKCVFGPVKSYWNKQLVKYGKEQMGHGCGRLQKCKFVEILGKTWEESMKKQNIISGFLSTGVFPVDPNRFPRNEFIAEDLERYEKFCNAPQHENLSQNIHLTTETSRIETTVSSLAIDSQPSQKSTIPTNPPSIPFIPQPSTSFILQSTNSITPQPATETTFNDLFMPITTNHLTTPVTVPKTVVPRLKSQAYGEVLTTNEVLSRLKEAEEKKKTIGKKKHKLTNTKREPKPRKQTKNIVRSSKEESYEDLCQIEDGSTFEEIEDNVALKAVDISSLTEGNFILVQCKGGKRGTTLLKNVCIVEEIYINEQIVKVSGLKFWNDIKTLFYILKNDIFFINFNQVLGLLPEPGIQMKGKQILYKFKGSVPVNE